MTTQYTPSLRLALPATGELDGLWGDVVNDQITELIEQALVGHTTINTWTLNAHTLTSVDGVVDEARSAVIVAQTGDGSVGSPFLITAPAQPKLYIVRNTTGNVLGFTCSAPGSNTLNIPDDHAAYIVCDGATVSYAFNYAANLRSEGMDVVDGTTAQSYVTLGAVSSVNLDARQANFYFMPVSPGGSVAVSLTPSVTSGLSQYVSFLALLVNPGTGTLIWPSSVRWPNNTAPIINSNTFNLFLFTTYSGSAFWYGAVLNNYAAI